VSESFEAQYLNLRATGARGWGDAQFGRRQAAWASSLTTLRSAALLPLPPSQVLELGCGNGAVSELLAAQGYAVEGVDISTAAIDWAQDRFRNLGLTGVFRQGDVRDMSDLQGDRYELGIDGNCLHCLIGDDRRRCLAEVRRLLTVGGAFIVSSMCGEPRSEAARAMFDGLSRCLLDLDDGRPTRTLASIDGLIGELRQAGFQVIWQHIAQNPWWDHLTAVTRVA
jgi:SAM-dependent methyltransferase